MSFRNGRAVGAQTQSANALHPVRTMPQTRQRASVLQRNITAAAPGGPRHDAKLVSDERSSITNGVWLCQNCARLTDVDPITYSTELLLDWRQTAEDCARGEIEGGRGPRPTPAVDPATQDGWGCPNCGTVVPNGHTVCLGCHAEAVYGSTREERQNDMNTALSFGGAGSALAVFALPSWLASEFAVSLSPGWGLGIYSAVPVVLCSLAAGFAHSIHEDTRRRQKPPQFFRSSIAQANLFFKRTCSEYRGLPLKSNVGREKLVRTTITFLELWSTAVELAAVLTHAEEGGFVALNPETGTTTQGETVEEAVANLREATALYLSEFSLPATGHPVVTMFTIPEPVHASAPPCFGGRDRRRL